MNSKNTKEFQDALAYVKALQESQQAYVKDSLTRAIQEAKNAKFEGRSLQTIDDFIKEMSMNTVAIDNRTYREVEAFAKLHNLDIAEVVRTSLQNFLQKFKVAKPQAKAAKYELPEHIEKLAGCLAGVEDPSDERLNYLLEKYK